MLKEIYQRKDYLQAAHFFQLYIRAVSCTHDMQGYKNEEL